MCRRRATNAGSCATSRCSVAGPRHRRCWVGCASTFRGIWTVAGETQVSSRAARVLTSTSSAVFIDESDLILGVIPASFINLVEFDTAAENSADGERVGSPGGGGANSTRINPEYFYFQPTNEAARSIAASSPTKFDVQLKEMTKNKCCLNERMSRRRNLNIFEQDDSMTMSFHNQTIDVIKSPQ